MSKIIGWFVSFVIIMVFVIFVIGWVSGYSCAEPSIDNIRDTPCISVFSNGKTNQRYRDMMWKCSTSRKCDGIVSVNQNTCGCECK
jgi:hypothetical protein